MAACGSLLRENELFRSIRSRETRFFNRPATLRHWPIRNFGRGYHRLVQANSTVQIAHMHYLDYFTPKSKTLRPSRQISDAHHALLWTLDSKQNTPDGWADIYFPRRPHGTATFKMSLFLEQSGYLLNSSCTATIVNICSTHITE